MAEEEWRDIPGYEGSYQASSLGRIRSLDRIIKRHKNGVGKWKGRILNPYIQANGYVYHRIQNFTCRAHRLIASAFLGLDRDDKSRQVNHKNGNRLDNRISNLELVTSAENIRHSFKFLGRKGTSLGKFGKDHHLSKAVVATSVSTGNTIFYESIRMAIKDGFDPSTISKVALGKKKTHKGHTWRYAGENDE